MDNLRGIALMTGGMAGFALADLFLKLASRDVSTAQIVLVQSIVGIAIFGPLALRNGQRVFSPAITKKPVVIRIAGEIVAVVGMTMGLSMTALSTATALMQVQPLIVMLGAVVFLGETVGWRRWLSVALGFVGVLIITRPASGIEPGLVWLLVGVCGLAARDLSTRRVDAGTSSVYLALVSFGALMPISALWLLVEGSAIWPGPATAAYLAAMSLCASLAFFLTTSSLRLGEVSAIIPFRYSRLVFALLLAVTVLGERPDPFVLLGAAVIIGSGLYALLRERAVARSRR